MISFLVNSPTVCAKNTTEEEAACMKIAAVWRVSFFSYFYFIFLFFETGFLGVTALAVLELPL